MARSGTCSAASDQAKAAARLSRTLFRRIVMRMPRMQVYLPHDLYREVKERGLAASELLQTAVAGEVRRMELEARADQYLEELVAEVGEPPQEDLARAQVLAGLAPSARAN